VAVFPPAPLPPPPPAAPLLELELDCAPPEDDELLADEPADERLPPLVERPPLPTVDEPPEPE